MTGLASAAGTLFAATPAGVRRSLDNGRTWHIAGEREAVPFAAVVLPSPMFEQDHAVYATGRAGAYRSRDGGNTWSLILGGSAILALATAPGILFAGSEDDGLLRSSDDGRTWSSANPGVLDLSILCVALSPDFAHDRVAFLGTTSGLYRSRNGGASWRSVELGGAEPAIQCLAMSPHFHTDHLVFAGTEDDGLLRSTDGGESWRPPPGLTARTVNALSISTNQEIAAATEQGVAISTDGGESWRLSTQPELADALSIHHLDGLILAGLAEAGVARSENHGASWTIGDDGLNARVLVRLAAPTATSLLAADLQGGVRISRDAGMTWTDSDLGVPGEPVTDLTTPSPGVVLAATGGGVRRAVAPFEAWQPVAGPSSAAARLVTSSHERALVLLEAHGLFASDDAGLSWHSLPTPFQIHQVASAALGPGARIYIVTHDANEVMVWRSVDHGLHWQRVLHEAASVAVVPLATSSASDDVFVALPGRVLHPLPHATERRGGERRPMWRSVHLDNAAITDLAVSPDYAHDKAVLVATNVGVLASHDGGQHLVPWSEGLEPASVVSLLWPEPSSAYALTLGGTVWRRQPLMQAGAIPP